MTFKPTIWFPIAVVLTVINVVAVAVPAPVGPMHAATHAALAVAFGLWAQRLRRSIVRNRNEPPPLEGAGEGRMEALEAEMSDLRQQLTETQERLDFTERLLAQGREKGQVGPQRE
jgi:hypothetical protein